jgi:transcription elongation factor Elf1
MIDDRKIRGIELNEGKITHKCNNLEKNYECYEIDDKLFLSCVFKSNAIRVVACPFCGYHPKGWGTLIGKV